MSKPTAYIAGKMRGIPGFNFPAFDAARRFLESAGWEVISPADLDRAAGEAWAEDHVFTEQEVREIARRDVDAVMSLRKGQGDALILLQNGTDPDWRDSVGARAELALAEWLGLKIFVLDIRNNKLYPITRVKIDAYAYSAEGLML